MFPFLIACAAPPTTTATATGLRPIEDSAAHQDTGSPIDTGDSADSSEALADTGEAPASPTLYDYDCDDGGTAAYVHRFPVRFDVGTDPGAGLWTIYDPGYVEALATLGLDMPSAQFVAGVALDADGYAVGTCSWFSGAGFAGYATQHLTLVVD